jgi:uncharacterized membrane protein required for colicin V production
MTYKKLETLSIVGTIAALAVAFFGAPLLQWYDPPVEQWRPLITAATFAAVFLLGVGVGAAFVEKE